MWKWLGRLTGRKMRLLCKLTWMAAATTTLWKTCSVFIRATAPTRVGTTNWPLVGPSPLKLTAPPRHSKRASTQLPSRARKTTSVIFLGFRRQGLHKVGCLGTARLCHWTDQAASLLVAHIRWNGMTNQTNLLYLPPKRREHQLPQVVNFCIVIDLAYLS